MFSYSAHVQIIQSRVLLLSTEMTPLMKDFSRKNKPLSDILDKAALVQKERKDVGLPSEVLELRNNSLIGAGSLRLGEQTKRLLTSPVSLYAQSALLKLLARLTSRFYKSTLKRLGTCLTLIL